MSHSISRDLLYSIFPRSSKYLTYDIGNSPIILSAPHGGGIKSINIPRRKYGNRSGDTYTRRLIQKIIKLLVDKPYYIYADIHRSRVDLNRNFTEATQGNKKAEKVWKDWNRILQDYYFNVFFKFSKGLYIDIHSHNKSDQFQIGYGLSVKDYLDTKVGWEIKNKSTMFPLKLIDKTEYHTLFGDGSIPDSIERFGYEVLIPDNDKTYLNGGYNIKEFNGNGIGAIQIECPIPVLKYDLNGVAVCLANSIEIFRDRFL